MTKLTMTPEGREAQSYSVCGDCPCSEQCSGSRKAVTGEKVKRLFPFPGGMPDPEDLRFVVNIEAESCLVTAHIWVGDEPRPSEYNTPGNRYQFQHGPVPNRAEGKPPLIGSVSDRWAAVKP